MGDSCTSALPNLFRRYQEQGRRTRDGRGSWKHHWVYPDVASDRKRFEELQSGNYTAGRDPTLQEIEAAGEHEILNWVPLAGAVDRLGQKPPYCDFIERYLMNSRKCVAIFPPNETTVGA